MSDTYEKDIAERTSDRNLILLGCRADADIDYRDKKIKQLQNDNALLEKVVEAAENYIKADAKKEMKVSLYYLNEALDLYKKAKHNSKGEDDE